MKKLERVAPCGLDCGSCPAYEANISDSTRAHFAGLLHCSPEESACKGCRPSEGSPLPCPDCKTYACAKDMGVHFCSECPDFPCRMLMPAADGATRFLHNTKLYNLSRIRLLGVENWLEEVEANRELYFTGTLVLGQGPVLKEGKPKD